MTEPVDPASWSCPTPVGGRDTVVLGHGGGGRLTNELVTEVFAPELMNAALEPFGDAAIVDVGGARLAMSTDAFVVEPLFFPGGDIGSLAVHGTVNDLACAGAVPLYLTASFVIEEGTSLATLRRVVASMGRAARAAKVSVVAGDTKVVERRGERGRDGIVITTAGVGLIRPEAILSPSGARVGDHVVLSGPIGLHGVAVMSVREGMSFGTAVESDSAPVHGLVAALFDAGIEVHVLRDPTRGGVAAVVNEIAAASGVGVVLDEAAISIPPAVSSACALLGIDPLQVANEGRLVAFVAPGQSGQAVEVLRRVPGGEQAAAVGEVVGDHPGLVVGRTTLGSTRIIDLPLGELLPRIC